MQATKQALGVSAMYIRHKGGKTVALISQGIRNCAPELCCLFEGLEDNVQALVEEFGLQEVNTFWMCCGEIQELASVPGVENHVK